MKLFWPTTLAVPSSKKIQHQPCYLLGWHLQKMHVAVLDICHEMPQQQASSNNGPQVIGQLLLHGSETEIAKQENEDFWIHISWQSKQPHVDALHMQDQQECLQNCTVQVIYYDPRRIPYPSYAELKPVAQYTKTTKRATSYAILYEFFIGIILSIAMNYQALSNWLQQHWLVSWLFSSSLLLRHCKYRAEQVFMDIPCELATLFGKSSAEEKRQAQDKYVLLIQYCYNTN